MRIGPWRALGLLAMLGAGGFLFAAAGFAPIAASSGHWPITERFLQFSKRRAVDTHSLGTKVPPLDHPADIARGAAHYETGCRPCHGGPDLMAPRVPRAMTPEPPYLPLRLATWSPRHLFWITKHGLKFTGMPAWPSQSRDDEVWAMVAFLRVFPDLDPGEYEEWVYGEPRAKPQVPPGLATAPEELTPAVVRDTCARCHGVDGNGRGMGAFPRLAGQRPAYLAASLAAYADGRRESGIMQPIAAGIDPLLRKEIATYFSRLPATTAPTPAETAPTGSAATGTAAIDTAAIDTAAIDTAAIDTAAIERGRVIALRGIPEEKVPSCIDCHGPGVHPRHPLYPNLAGQYDRYLTQQLRLFKQGHRGGSEAHHLMQQVARGMNETAIRDVAAYYASLTAAPSTPPRPSSP